MPVADKKIQRAAIGNKVNWKELQNQAKEMRDSLEIAHEKITAIWKAQKCRELGTVESSVRNAVDHLDRLPDAIERFLSKTAGTSTGTKDGSRLTKPRG